MAKQEENSGTRQASVVNVPQGLNVRSHPNGAILYVAEYGTKFETRGFSNEDKLWTRIVLPGTKNHYGYVLTEFLCPDV